MTEGGTGWYKMPCSRSYAAGLHSWQKSHQHNCRKTLAAHCQRAIRQYL